MVASNFPNRPFGLRESTWVNYQEIGNNRTNWHGELWIDRYNGNYNTYSGGASSFTFFLNGSQVAGWSFTYNFNNYNNLLLAAVDVWVPHNSDGTKTAPIDGYANVDIMGYTEVHSSFGFPTIPRASTATWASAGNPIAGVAKTLNTNRASSGFTHTIDYTFGAATGNVGTGIGASVSWTPPLSLLNQMPNTDKGAGKFKTYTYNGGSLIGTTESNFILEPDAAVIPTWTSATRTEGTTTPDVATIIGAGKYVQGVSKPVGTITGAAGVYGSTISSYRQQVGTEVINAATANFTKVLTTAGSAIDFTQEITDSRGRKKTLVSQIEVLPYSKPVISSFTFQRWDATNNVADNNGTAIRATVIGAVQSLVNGTERNRLTLRFSSKLRSSSTWTVDATPVVDSTTLAYNSSFVLPGPYAVTTAFDVKAELIDKFNTTSSQKVATTGEIFQHWSTGLGAGKYWEKGMVDIAGDAYASGGFLSMGKRITDWNAAIYEGRYHSNTASNSPPVGPASGDTGNQCVGDVETWYEVQGATVFHYVKQTVKWINGTGVNFGARNLVNSFLRGYAMTRYSQNGGSTWSAWVIADNKVRSATSQLGLSSIEAATGRHFINAAGLKFVDLNGVFIADYTHYRVDYYYRTGDSNGNWFRLKSGTTDPANIKYTYQNLYIYGNGTPQGANTTADQCGMAAVSGEVHWGHIDIYNPMSSVAGRVKAFEGVDCSPNGTTRFAGSLSGVSGANADTTLFDGFKLSLSNTTINDFQSTTGPWIKVSALS